uniref:Uncharacterized protein n=1 Tax=Salix viminalis TaxID=40686 RepID=A0A6N2MBP1_SALVM
MEAGIVPVRLLFDNAKLVRDLMFPMEAGIVPFRLLFDNNKLVRDLRFPMEADCTKIIVWQLKGRTPLRLLSDKSSNPRDPSVPTSGGISPEKSELSIPISFGMKPEMLLEDKSRMVRLERIPICEGMDP